MSDTYAGAPTYHATITTLTDNDEPSGALFSAPLEQLKDICEHTRARVLAAEAGLSGALSNLNSLLAIQQAWRQYSIGLTPVAFGGFFPLAAVAGGDSGFTLSSDRVTVPAAGLYLVQFSGAVTSSSVANPHEFSIGVKVGAAASLLTVTTRYSASTTHSTHIAGLYVVNVTTPGTDTIGLVAGASGSNLGFTGDSRLFVRRLS